MGSRIGGGIVTARRRERGGEFERAYKEATPTIGGKWTILGLIFGQFYVRQFGIR